MQYWKTHQKDLIFLYLNMANENHSDITLWQLRSGVRVTYEAEFIEVSVKNCRLKINDPRQTYVEGEPFYVHIPGIDVIFKRENYSKIADYLDFSIPSDIQIFEKRRTKRFTYKYQDHKNITIRSVAETAQGTPEFTISSILVDISTAGAGLVLDAAQIGNIEKHSELQLLDITDQKLPNPFKVKVVYSEPYQSKEPGLFKIGILFNDELDSISYKSITSIIEIKQKKTRGISQEKYCGLDNEEQVRILNSIEAKNKVLAANIKDNIEYLDRLRYMTTKMKIDLLKSVNHDLLAVALRLSSKELIYDLLTELTDTMQKEFLDKLAVEKPASGICKAQDSIVKIIREKEAIGEIILDPTAFVTYV